MSGDGPIFELLGPVQARCGERAADLGPRKRRFVLAVLALEVNRLVMVDRLVDLCWPDSPPATAQATIRSHVSGLRAALTGISAAGHGVVLQRQGPGYLLNCPPDRVDAHRFSQLTEAAAAEPDDQRRVALLDTALALWRGPVLAGAASEQIRRQLAGHLEEARLTAVTDRLDGLLRLGRDHGVVDLLTRLVAEHPHRHRITGLLMLALHRTGRTPEALRTYRDTRRRLTDDLGLDPPAELQRLEMAILRDDPSLAAPARSVVAAPAATTTAAPRPAQLPADLPTFTGRQNELATVLRLLPDAGEAAPAVVVSAVDGMAGVGKTALAVHAAHQVRDRFPDGQLFLDLHGFTQGIAPVEPADALERLLHGLGVPGEQVPPGLDDRAAAYRTVLDDRRMLILLDNAATEAQVQPLLPAAPGCLVLVTSRRRLTGLDCAHPLSLDVLPSDVAVELLTRVAGAGRLADAPPGLVEEVARLCDGLPLALRLAAARLRARPAWNLADLAVRLRDARRRLAELEAGQRSAAAAFQLSYQNLDPQQRQAFRLLGLHPGPDIDTFAAAALTGTTPADADRLLEILLDSHLVQQHAPDRYQLHDLLRVYAAHAAENEDPERRRLAAVGRLLDYYVHTATVALGLAYPDETDWLHIPPPDTAVPDIDLAERATAWLDAEHANLLAATLHGRPDRAITLATNLHRHLRTRGRYADARTLHAHAHAIARATGDRLGEHLTLRGLGDIHYLQDQAGPAIDCFERSLAIAREIGHRTGELHALRGLGDVHSWLGENEQAINQLQRSLAIAQEVGSHSGEVQALRGLGDVHSWLGEYEQAINHFERSLAITRENGSPTELQTLRGLGDIHRLQGRYEQAIDHYERSLAIAQEIGSPTGELRTLRSLGDIHRLQGRYEQAIDHLERSLAIAAATGHRSGEVDALCGLGEAHCLLGRYDRAADYLDRSLTIARDLGNHPGQLYALLNLGDVSRAQHKLGQARESCQQALAIAEQIGDRNGAYEALHRLGHLHQAAGDPNLALDHHQQALDLATALDQRHDQARARDGLADAYDTLGDADRARRHWRQALAIYTELGTPEAARTRDRLAQTATPHPDRPDQPDQPDQPDDDRSA